MKGIKLFAWMCVAIGVCAIFYDLGRRRLCYAHLDQTIVLRASVEV